jgi:ABC-2 type transport system ATP-binding protein
MCDRIAIIQNGKLIDVKTLQEMVQNGNGEDLVTVHFEVSDPAASQEIIHSYSSDAPTNVIATGINVGLKQQQISEINAHLVQAGIKVSGIRVLAQSLEDKFLEMTRGEEIV